MAEKKSPYEDKAEYEVKLMRTVMFRGAKLLPLPTHDMSGKMLNALIEQEGGDVVDTAHARK